MKPTINEGINAWIDSAKTEMLKHLEEWVNTDSASDNHEGTAALSDLLGKRFAEIGFKVNKEPNGQYGDTVVCKLPGGGGNTLLVGHYDTALPKGSTLQRPFKVDGNKGLGCGVADMKSGILVMLFAIKAIQANTGLKPDLTVILNGDEEPGSPHSRIPITREAAGAERAFILEPNDENTITTRRKGVGIFTFSFKGIPSHAGQEPEKGRSAIVELGHKIVELTALTDFGKGITVNVGVVQGGTYPYVVAENASAKVDCRILTKADGDYIKREFDRIVGSNHVKDVEVKWEGGFHRPAMDRTPANAGLLEKVLRISEELKLGAAEGPLRGGASDGNLVSAMGIPTLCGMGPEGYGAHSTDEYVVIDSIFNRTKLLAQCLYNFYA